MRTCLVLGAVLVLTLAASPAGALQVGDKAPLFEGPSTQGTIRLADYFGRKYVILAFYFADFTPG